MDVDDGAAGAVSSVPVDASWVRTEVSLELAGASPLRAASSVP
jgi:hypothetical protein